MAVDKKSDHYTSAKNYTDLDGLSKSFTFIDHDVKTKIGTNKPLSDEQKEDLKEKLRQGREDTIQKILAIPAIYCADVYTDFTMRGDVSKVTWNETMLRDPGIDSFKLYSIWVVAHNKMQLIQQGITP